MINHFKVLPRKNYKQVQSNKFDSDVSKSQSVLFLENQVRFFQSIHQCRN